MVNEQEFKIKYYTEDGINSLEGRLKTIYAIWKETEKDKYPITFTMWGFPPLVLKSQEECEGHINELQQILMCKIIE